MSSTERVAKHRMEKKMYEAGYNRKPFTVYGHALDSTDYEARAAWCKGLWQSYTDTGMYDLTPKTDVPDLKPEVAKKGRR
jgi:hypothetical protein